MSKPNLPATIPKQPISVPVDIPEVLPNDADMVKAFESQGLVAVDRSTLKDLSIIGSYVHGAGTVKLQRGRTMVTQQRLDEAIRDICKVMRDVSDIKKRKAKVQDMARLAQSLGYLAARQLDSVEMMLKLEGGQLALEPGAPTDGIVPGFTPGADVKANQNMIFTREVHISTSEPPATAK